MLSILLVRYTLVRLQSSFIFERPNVAPITCGQVARPLPPEERPAASQGP